MAAEGYVIRPHKRLNPEKGLYDPWEVIYQWEDGGWTQIAIGVTRDDAEEKMAEFIREEGSGSDPEPLVDNEYHGPGEPSRF